MLYYYDVQTNTTRKITFEEAQRYTYNDNPTSPDGFEIKSDQHVSLVHLIFSPSRNSNVYLVGHGTSYELNVHENSYYWSPRIKLIAWVVETNGQNQ